MRWQLRLPVRLISMRFSLDKIANASVIVAAVVVTAVATLQLTREYRARSTSSSSSSRAAVLIGKQVQLPHVNFAESTATVVLALSSSCHYCTNSLPFYRELVRFQEASARNGKRIHVIAAMPQPETEGNRYMKANNLSVGRVVSTDLKTLGVSATPSLLVVNARGVVEAAWVGMLTADKQSAVVKTLRDHCGQCL